MSTEQQIKAYNQLKEDNQLGTINGFKTSPHELYIYHVKNSKNYITAIHESGLVTHHISNKKDTEK